METNKPLARAGYLVSALLVVIPFVDSIAQVLPLRLGEERWSFGALGQLSNLMLVPLLGLLLIITIATIQDSRRVKRVFGAICGILAILFGIFSVLFIMDYFQVRGQVSPNGQHTVAVATAIALLKNVFSIISLALLSRAGFAGPGVTTVKKVAPPSVPSATPLIPLSGAARAE